jgi:hypothetical protein
MDTLFALADKWETRFSMNAEHRGLYEDALHLQIREFLKEWGSTIPEHQLQRYGATLRALKTFATTRAPVYVDIFTKTKEIVVRYQTNGAVQAKLCITRDVILGTDYTNSSREMAFPLKWETTLSV